MGWEGYENVKMLSFLYPVPRVGSLKDVAVSRLEIVLVLVPGPCPPSRRISMDSRLLDLVLKLKNLHQNSFIDDTYFLLLRFLITKPEYHIFKNTHNIT